MPDSIRIPSHRLARFVEKLFRAQKLPAPDARLVAEMIVLQEMRGVRTHGLRRVAPNLEGLERGTMNPLPRRKVLSDRCATMVLDGDHGVGMVGCLAAMELAVSKAGSFGVGVVVIRNNNHFLSAAPYCLRAVEKNMIGIAFSNTQGSMGYPGTDARAIGNGPLGFAIPTSARFPIVYDGALAISGGKLAQFIRENKKIQDELSGLDSTGNETDDPEKVLHGGTPMPIGSHKGAGIAVLVEILTGVLGGGAFLKGIVPAERRAAGEDGESQCCLAINIAHFMPVRIFRKRAAGFIADLKSNPLAPGHLEILLPGEKAHQTLLTCRKNGVPIEADVREELRRWADKMKIPPPF